MNTDDYKIKKKIRDTIFERNMYSSQVKCPDIKKYATDQQATYDPTTGKILYGDSTIMHTLGVSNGTCDQLNPMLKTNRYKCGFGAAGGNPCVPDHLNYRFEKIYKNKYVNKIPKKDAIESFDLLNTRMKMNGMVIFALIVLLLAMIYFCD